MDLSHWIDRQADFAPDKTAIRCGKAAVNYAGLARDIAHLAGVLARDLGVGRGDRVAMLAMNRIECLTLAFACARIGAIYQPLNWRQAPPEHAFMLGDATPLVLFAEGRFTSDIDSVREDFPPMRLVAVDGPAGAPWMSLSDLMAEAGDGLPVDPDVAPDTRFLLCYTSGTTGRPKGAVLTQEAIFTNAVNSAHMHGLTCRDEVLTPIPLFHVGGLNILSTPALHVGATLHLTSTFDVAETFDILEDQRITLTVLVPAQLSAMIADPRWQSADLTALRTISTGSTMVPTRLIETVHRRGIPVIQVYGSTETAPLAAYLTEATAKSGIGSGGKRALHCELMVVDDAGREVPTGASGEVLVRGPSVMSEFWNSPAATAEVLRDGWFHTGDIGHFDAQGFLFIDDRKKDMIISGSENIYPAMLENVLADCPGIREAAVVGRPDAQWGEVPVAVVTRADGAALDAAAVIAHFHGRVGRYAVPREVLFVEALPRNAMGKVVKDEVRKMVREAMTT